MINYFQGDPVLVASGLISQKLHINVYGTGTTIYLGHTRVELQPQPGVPNPGLAIAPGPVELQWSGDVWATAASGVIADIAIEPKGSQVRTLQHSASSGGGSGGGTSTAGGGTSGDQLNAPGTGSSGNKGQITL